MTYVYFQKFFPLRSEIECNPVNVTWQRGCSHQQDQEDEVGKESCEVDQLQGKLSKVGNMIVLHFTFPMDLIPFQRAQ